MTTKQPTDLRPLTELSLDLRIPYATLRYWQRAGYVAEHQENGIWMASEAEVRAYASRPRRKLPKRDE